MLAEKNGQVGQEVLVYIFWWRGDRLQLYNMLGVLFLSQWKHCEPNTPISS